MYPVIIIMINVINILQMMELINLYNIEEKIFLIIICHCVNQIVNI